MESGKSCSFIMVYTSASTLSFDFSMIRSSTCTSLPRLAVVKLFSSRAFWASLIFFLSYSPMSCISYYRKPYPDASIVSLLPPFRLLCFGADKGFKCSGTASSIYLRMLALFEMQGMHATEAQHVCLCISVFFSLLKVKLGTLD